MSYAAWNAASQACANFVSESASESSTALQGSGVVHQPVVAKSAVLNLLNLKLWVVKLAVVHRNDFIRHRVHADPSVGETVSSSI